MSASPYPEPSQALDPGPLPPEAVQFPLGWFLANAAPPLQYRALTDVVGWVDEREVYRNLALASRSSLTLAVAQAGDGTWHDAMLSAPPPVSRHGTIPAYRRLLESGWDRESPPLARARRILFRLLAEDNDADQLYEFRQSCAGDADLTQRARTILREAAAAALAHAGYESDPRLRGAARRILARVDAYLTSPLAEKPWVRVGNRQVLAADAAPPSIHVLTMLAHMPLFRSENHSPVNRLLAYVSQPMPRQEAQQVVGKHLVAQPHLILGDPLPSRNATEADIPFALGWLELMARLQYLKRNDGWLQIYERFLDGRDRDFVWRPSRGSTMESDAPEIWSSFPLGDRGDYAADVTFRLGLVARLLGRTIEPV